MNKLVRKVTGVILLIALLVTTAGTSAQAANWIKWPYGKYKASSGFYKGFMLEWEFGDGTGGYDNYVVIYPSDSKPMYGDEYYFKRTKTINRYKGKDTKNNPKKCWYTIEVKKKSLVFKEYNRYSWNNKVYKTTFKIKKRLSKNVG